MRFIAILKQQQQCAKLINPMIIMHNITYLHNIQVPPETNCMSVTENQSPKSEKAETVFTFFFLIFALPIFPSAGKLPAEDKLPWAT